MIVNYRYWNKIRNCGDAITAYILRDVMGLTPRTVSRDGPHLLATGSIFFSANENSQIWGSGIIRAGAEIKLPSAHIHAVRGHKTLAVLQAARPEIGDLPLGDPGILVDYLLNDPEFAALPVKYAAAIVPHHRALARGKVKAASEELCLVDMRDNSLMPLRQIQQSRVVISQSLHGLVFAAALGKPYVWISENDSDEWRFKFEDFLSTVDNPQADPLAIDTPLETLIAAAEIRPCMVDRAALLAAFPHDLVCVPADRAVLDFSVARAMPVAVVRSDSAVGLEARRFLHGTKYGARRAAYVQKALRQAFAGWSELPYVMVLPTGLAMPAVDLGELASFLDRNPGVGALTIPPAGAPAPDGEIIRRLSTENADVTEGASFADAAIVLRPSMAFSPDLAFFTYRVR